MDATTDAAAPLSIDALEARFNDMPAELQVMFRNFSADVTVALDALKARTERMGQLAQTIARYEAGYIGMQVHPFRAAWIMFKMGLASLWGRSKPSDAAALTPAPETR